MIADGIVSIEDEVTIPPRGQRTINAICWKDGKEIQKTKVEVNNYGNKSEIIRRGIVQKIHER